MFENRVAVVTGGGSGIGKALCEQLAERGARVAVADIAVEDAQAVVTAIGSGACAFPCDVADPDAMRNLAVRVKQQMGAPAFVFANAGVALGGKVMETDPCEFRWLLDVNVGGVFHAAQAFLPGLIAEVAEGNPAGFVITGSENSLGLPVSTPFSVYTATKHALLGLADAMRRDLAGTGVQVSIFCPGMVATRLWDARRSRQGRYGGAASMPADFAARADATMQRLGMDPGRTAALALCGVERGDFLIITDPRLREMAELRISEVAEALSRVDGELLREHG